MSYLVGTAALILPPTAAPAPARDEEHVPTPHIAVWDPVVREPSFLDRAATVPLWQALAAVAAALAGGYVVYRVVTAEPAPSRAASRERQVVLRALLARRGLSR